MKQSPDDKLYLAIGAAEFKLEEATFFLLNARAKSGDPTLFRYYIDAALDAVDGSAEIARGVCSMMPSKKKDLTRDLGTIGNRQITRLVLGNRNRAHHRTSRAELVALIESGSSSIDGFVVNDHVELKLILTPGLEQPRLTWMFLDGGAWYDALKACEVVRASYADFVAKLRAESGLPPEKGLKRVGLQILKAMPTSQEITTASQDKVLR